ncbi:MAG: hypothetical protein ACK5Z5_06805, partial [Neisseriaceae bacterium]
VESNKHLSINIMPIAEFINYIIKRLKKYDKIEADILMKFLLIQGWLEVDGMYQSSQRVYLQRYTQNILNFLNFEWPSITNEQFGKYLNIILNDDIY